MATVSIALLKDVAHELEICVTALRQSDGEAAIAAMTTAVELCENEPTRAIRSIDGLDRSLQQIVRGCISEALRGTEALADFSALLRRIESVTASAIN